jgi:hypothetical protein
VLSLQVGVEVAFVYIAYCSIIYETERPSPRNAIKDVGSTILALLRHNCWQWGQFWEELLFMAEFHAKYVQVNASTGIAPFKVH